MPHKRHKTTETHTTKGDMRIVYFSLLQEVILFVYTCKSNTKSKKTNKKQNQNTDSQQKSLTL
jgi:hypothetical protein